MSDCSFKKPSEKASSSLFTSSSTESDSTDPTSTPETSDSSSLEEKDANVFKYKPEDVIKFQRDELSEYELEEIKSYSDIYYFAPGVPKRIGKPDTPRNDNYDDANKYYIAIPNDHLAYRYELLKQIGFGTYGTVYKAFDHKYCRLNAIKIFRSGPYFNISANHEITILNHLKNCGQDDSKNIIRYFETFTFRRHFCISYELLQINLSVLVSQNKNGVNLKNIRTILKSILVGLAFIHKNGVIHADLKSANIVLKSIATLECKIVDFGMSFFEENGHTNKLIQAPAYRAPEVFLFAPFDSKVDIWSFGCIGGELARGRLLFDGDTEERQMANYVDYFGFPPKELIKQSLNANSFFFVYPAGIAFNILPGYNQCKPNSKSLKDALRIRDDEMFVNFIKKSLEMDPLKRPSAKELLEHPWIRGERFFELAQSTCIMQ